MQARQKDEGFEIALKQDTLWLEFYTLNGDTFIMKSICLGTGAAIGIAIIAGFILSWM